MLLTTTETHTQAQPQQIIHLQARSSLGQVQLMPASEFDLVAKLDELKNILNIYKDEQDPYSRSLHNWGKETYKLFDQEIINESTLQTAEERIDHLLRVMLINPFDGSPLKKPVLVNGRIYENWNYRQLKIGLNISPYDVNVTLDEKKNHLFAKILSAWARSIPRKRSSALTALGLPISAGVIRYLNRAEMTDGRYSDEDIFLIYRNLARNVLLKEENVRAREQLETMMGQMALFESRTLDKVDRLIEQRRQSDLIHTENLNRELSGIRETTQRERAVLENRCEDLTERLETEEEKVQRLEREVFELENKTVYLEALSEQRRRQIEALSGKKPRGGCVVS